MKQIKDTIGLFSKTADVMRRDGVAAKQKAPNQNKSWLSTKIDFLKSEFFRIKEELKDLKGTNYRLGLAHYKAGHSKDARTRFKILKFFYKDIKELDYFIGRTYFEDGYLEKGKKHLLDYLSSGHKEYLDEANYTLNRINQKFDNITGVPKSLIAHYYNMLAEYYNEIFINDRAVSPQNVLYEMLNRNLAQLGLPYGHIVLDMGCGSGYIGRLLKNSKVAVTVDGVDLSEKMIEVASAEKVDGQKVYDILKCGDAMEYLANASTQYSIIIASNFLGHNPKPEEFFKLVHSKLKDGGVLVFTFKVLNDDTKKLQFDQITEDFRFNGKNIMNMISNDNWKLLLSMPITFIEEEDTGLVIVQKK